LDGFGIGFAFRVHDGLPQSVPKEDTVAVAAPIEYLALGDSYTIGEGVAEDQRWPVQLATGLRARGLKVTDPKIIARTGWTTSDLSAAMDQENPQGPYGLVTLLIGVNNEYRGESRSIYRSEFKALLARAVALAGGKPEKVFVLSIPDWGASFYGIGEDTAMIAADIDAFNAINLEETRAQGAGYVDITGVSRAASGDTLMFAGDGLHPSGRQYGQWVDLTLAKLAAAAAAFGA
jgi:lysophospholipase L1-like esterase